MNVHLQRPIFFLLAGLTGCTSSFQPGPLLLLLLLLLLMDGSIVICKPLQDCIEQHAWQKSSRRSLSACSTRALPCSAALTSEALALGLSLDLRWLQSMLSIKQGSISAEANSFTLASGLPLFSSRHLPR